jgi:hypothetical protein
VVFDEELGFATGAWVAAGCREGSPGKSARKSFAAIAMAGSDDGNRASAAASVDYLEEKVKSVEFHEQAGIGHEWPRELMPYYGWWLDVQEGRFTPGACKAFAWADAGRLGEIAADGTGGKAGAFAYVYDKDATTDADAKELENEVLRDPAVHSRRPPLTPETASGAALEEFRATANENSLPAVIVHDPAGKPKSVVTAPFKAKTLAAALNVVAPSKKPP